ncbi:hypothetical protein L1049_003416 [Liquidambar formosana]|uniref:Uncharacterized protein n=1 Tax=Liquidambar formosana TaxID=63359 RepID=A0AAP0N3L4_LIQFO
MEEKKKMPASVSKESEVVKRNSREKNQLPPIRGRIKRRIFASFIQKMKLLTRNTIHFLINNGCEIRSVVGLPLECPPTR